MASELIVRRAEGEDFDAWYDLFEGVAAERTGIATEPPLDREAFRTTFTGWLGSPHKARFLAVLDGLIVGELGVSDHYGVTDLGMMVRDGHRGQGVGSALMEACIDWSRSVGAYKVTLTVFPHNEAGLALYRKHGFVAEGRLVRHYRRRNGELWDAIPMGLLLDDTSPGSSLADAEGGEPLR